MAQSSVNAFLIPLCIVENLILSIVDIDTTQMNASASPISQMLQDKSQIGCYVHMNHRLQDVMVLSDHSY